MGVKAYIENLGPIKDSEIDFRQFIIYTGDSGLGKSYTAMLWYYFLKTLSSEFLIDFIRNKYQSKTIGEQRISLSIQFSELRKYINQGVARYIGSLIGNTNFMCSVVFEMGIPDDERINLSVVSPQGENDVSTFHANDISISIPSGINDVHWGLSYILSRFLTKRILDRNFVMPFIFPPARAAFVGGKQTSSSVGMYAEYNNQLAMLMRTATNGQNDDQFFKSMISKLVDGEIITEENEVLVQLRDGIKIPISSAASSVKELAPLFFALKSSPLYEFYSILFEEPEAHVHPLKQQMVADIIARCINKGMMFQITTHSDFLMTRINQLIRLGNIRQANNAIFEQYCERYGHNKNLYLDNNIIMACYFYRDKDGVRIQSMDISNGIPFNTFDTIVKKQMEISANIAEYGQKAGIDTTV